MRETHLSFGHSFALSAFLALAGAWAVLRVSNRPTLLLVVAVATLIAHALIYLPFTVDDSFIAFRYATNWAHGLGPVYQAGTRVEGFTSFAWMALIALGERIGIAVDLTAKTLGLLFAALTLLPALYLAKQWGASDRAAAVAPFILALSPLYAAWTVGGMDAPMFAALISSSTWALAVEERKPGRPPLSAILLGFAVWVRPDGWLFLAVALLMKLQDIRANPSAEAASPARTGGRNRGQAQAPAHRERAAPPDSVVRWGLVALLIAGTFWAWRWAYYGHPFPNTFYAKTRTDVALLGRGLSAAWEFVGYVGPVLIGLSIISFGPLRRAGQSGRFAFAASVAYFLYVILVGGDTLNLRFFVHILPIVAACSAVGLTWLLDAKEGAFALPRVSLPSLMGVSLIWVAAAYEQDRRAFDSIDQYGAGYVVNNARALYLANIPLGKWLHNHAPRGARIAAWDIGAIGYFSQLQVIDLFGLTDVTIARITHGPDPSENEQAYLERLRPEFIATYSSGPDSTHCSWFPSGTAWLLSEYRYHSHWADQGPGTGPALWVRKDIVVDAR